MNRAVSDVRQVSLAFVSPVILMTTATGILYIDPTPGLRTAPTRTHPTS
jgi:hypothetical protein